MGHLRRRLLASIDVNKMKGQQLNRGGEKGTAATCRRFNSNRNAVLALYGAQISPHRRSVPARQRRFGLLANLPSHAPAWRPILPIPSLAPYTAKRPEIPIHAC